MIHSINDNRIFLAFNFPFTVALLSGLIMLLNEEFLRNSHDDYELLFWITSLEPFVVLVSLGLNFGGLCNATVAITNSECFCSVKWALFAKAWIY